RRASSQPNLIVPLQRLQILDELALFLAGQPEAESGVVVVDHGRERWKAPVVVEAARLMRPQAGERRGAVHVRRRAVGLERIDPDVLRRMHVVAWLGEERRDVAGRALSPAVEHFLPLRSRGWIEAASGRLRRRDGELVEVQRTQLRRY